MITAITFLVLDNCYSGQGKVETYIALLSTVCSCVIDICLAYIMIQIAF